MRQFLVGLVVFLACSACAEDAVVIEAEIVQADGKPLLQDGQPATLRLELQQESLPTQVFEASWPADTHSWTMPVSRGLPVRILSEFTHGDASVLLGTSIDFAPTAARHGVRVILAKPSSCETLSDLQLFVPRHQAGVAGMGTTGVIAGGESEGESSSIEFIDLIRMERYDFVDELDMSLGATSIVAIDYHLMLVISENQPTFLYDIAIPGIVPTYTDIGSISTPDQPEYIEFETGVRIELVGNQSETISNALQICIPESIDVDRVNG